VSTLDDRPRSGRPARVSTATRCDVVKLACDKPASHGVEHRVTWTYERDNITALFVEYLGPGIAVAPAALPSSNSGAA